MTSPSTVLLRTQSDERLVALARSLVKLFLQVSGRCVYGRRFAILRLNRGLPFYRLSAPTASLHVATSGG